MLRSLILLGGFTLAAVVRIHGAWSASPLSGFDGPYHAAYIGTLFFDGRLPLMNEGWSTDHPPFYYALCALIWRVLPADASAHAVLFALRLVNVVAGLALGVVVHATARRLAPDRPWVRDAAAFVALYVPMLVPPSFLLGNEILAAALCGGATLALVRVLEAPESPSKALALGAVLGLAVATKLSAVTVLAGAIAVLLVAAIRGREARVARLRSLGVVVLAFFSIAGWVFARGWIESGDPLMTQNSVESREMIKQGYGPPRSIGAYFSFRPDVLFDPGDRSAAATAPVWPLTFASIWFDAHGTTLDVRKPWARRLAPPLLLFGVLWTFCAGLGLVEVARGRAALCVPLSALALALQLAATLAAYVVFTRQVATWSALKGTYLSSATPAFAIFVGLGIDRLASTGRRARLALGAGLALVAALVSASFWVGWLAPLPFDPAAAYRLVYTDPATERVISYFLPGSGRP
jgi:4-amino-4-deoxy-L-arabinose transferase-like glycosyltransferase